MAIHTIRLRVPWNQERQDDRDIWQRPFGRPTNLSEQEIVRLVLRCKSAGTLVTLNGELLGSVETPGEYAAFDVTERLDLRNMLTLSIAADEQVQNDSREPPVDVWLEIVSDSDG